MSLPCTRRSVWFDSPGQIAVREEPLPAPRPGQVLVETQLSAISPGTEMLFYRGQVPPDMAIDATIPELARQIAYPLKYGYACVGKVIQETEQMDPAWTGRLVFAFHPHESHFWTEPENLIPVPSGLSPEQATLLPNMETAVNFVLDGAPLLGERVIVYGQGIVGLLTTSLLARFPLACLIAVDPIALRRAFAEQLGAHMVLDPGAPDYPARLRDCLSPENRTSGADLVFELSGNPQALNDAINHTGFHGRILVGSWYGAKRATIDLGGHFHRNRIRLISSQVSTISPEHSGRWDRLRRLDLAWAMLQNVKTDGLITHRFDVEQAADAYSLVDRRPDRAIHVLIDYRTRPAPNSQQANSQQANSQQD